MNNRSVDIAIVGGGIIGCAIAYYLSKTYQADVAVFEKGEIGQQASSAAAGLLAPLGPLSGPGPFADLLLAGFHMFSELVPELESESDMSLGYEQIGALRTVRNPKRVSRLRKRMDAWQPLGLKMQWLSGDEAREIEPDLSPDVCAAVYAPEESQIRASFTTQAFYQAATRLGTHFNPRSEVVNIQHKGSRVTGLYLQNDEFVSCNHIVIATGAWAAVSGAWLDMPFPVSPLKGQIVEYARTSSRLQHIVFGDGTYIAPRGETIIVGATKEEVGFDIQVTEEGHNQLRDTAEKFVPFLQKSTITKSWAGLRPKTPNTRPLLGSAPGWENVTVAIGHNSVGIMLSAITGKTIADLVAKSQAAEVIVPFSPKEASDYEGGF